MRARSRSSRPSAGWRVLVIALVAALGFAYGAYQLAAYSWAQVVDYQSPFTSIDPATTRVNNPGEDKRVVLVIIDGLTDAASRSMPAMNRLRARGADVLLTVSEPSLSYPTWTTILSGAPQQISGVTTNWYDREVEVETLLDVAQAEGRSTLVVGPTDLDTLYGASEADASAFTDWVSDAYMSGTITDDALRLDSELGGAGFVLIHLPDIDEAGHQYGAASSEYTEMVARVDADLQRLVDGLDDGETVFCVTPDHGHIAAGGHGGWEDSVIHTSCVFAGPGVALGSSRAELEDIAPTIAVLSGLPTPGHAKGIAIASILTDPDSLAVEADLKRAGRFSQAYSAIIRPSVEPLEPALSAIDVRVVYAAADTARLESDRSSRLAPFVAAAAVLTAFGMIIALWSWQAMVSMAAGTAAYFGVYHLFFSVMHGYTVSLSSFNKESMVQSFFNERMVESIIAGLIACAVAALVYPLLRARPQPPRNPYLAGWLVLGVSTTLSIQAVLALRAAVFWRLWGTDVVWRLPDMQAAFQYDLDLVQISALGALAILGPGVTYVIGRLHPRTRKTASA